MLIEHSQIDSGGLVHASFALRPGPGTRKVHTLEQPEVIFSLAVSLADFAQRPPTFH